MQTRNGCVDPFGEPCANDTVVTSGTVVKSVSGIAVPDLALKLTVKPHPSAVRRRQLKGRHRWVPGRFGALVAVETIVTDC